MPLFAWLTNGFPRNKVLVLSPSLQGPASPAPSSDGSAYDTFDAPAHGPRLCPWTCSCLLSPCTAPPLPGPGDLPSHFFIISSHFSKLVHHSLLSSDTTSPQWSLLTSNLNQTLSTLNGPVLFSSQFFLSIAYFGLFFSPCEIQFHESRPLYVYLCTCVPKNDRYLVNISLNIHAMNTSA